jgi:predicted nucleic acid-binding protein
LANIFWDTNLFIYLFEDNGEKADRVAELWSGMQERGDRLYTSSFTLGEVLALPARTGARDLEQQYLSLFRSSSITLVHFEFQAAVHYAKIRVDAGIRPPDAIQLACAACAQVDLFITNDERLSRKRVPEVKFITSLTRSPI